MQQELGIRDLYFMVIVHLRGMWRHRWHMFFVAWFICLTGWGAVTIMEDHYMASAAVKIEDPGKEFQVYLPNATGMDVTREARRVLNKLMDRESLLKVIAETDLAFSVNSDLEKEEALSRLRAQLELKHLGNNVYRISHRHNTPLLTLQVVRALMKLLPLEQLDIVTGGKADAAQKILSKRIKDYEDQLMEAETRLRGFTKKNLLLLPGQEGGYYDRLRKVKEEIDKEEARQRQLEEQRQEMRRQLEDIMRTVESPTRPIELKIAELGNRLRELKSQVYIKGGQKRPLYSDNHADVITLRASIASLESRRDDIMRKMQDGADDPDLWELEANPVFRQLRMSVSELDVELAAVQGRLRENRRRLERLLEQENVLPKIESEFMRLSSRVERIKATLKEMVENELNAQEESDTTIILSRMVRFKVVERPTLPIAPYGPNRPLFHTVVLISGLLAGVAVAMFFAVMRPVFDSPSALKKTLGLPVLGMVSMVDEGGAGWWMNSRLLYFTGLVGLLVIYFFMMKGFKLW